MNRTLSNIKNLSTIDQNGDDNIYYFDEVDFEDEPIASGAFGSVHEVLRIDDKYLNHFVLKIVSGEKAKQHSYDVINLLHQKIKVRQIKTQIPIYHDYPELLGLPFAVFTATDTILNNDVIGFLMYDLRKLGFEDYGADNIDSPGGKDLSFRDKIYLSYQFSKAVSFLNNLKFIHSDLKEASLFINNKRKQLVLIDFDGGYHYEEQSNPFTIGAVTHWLSTKFKKLIRKKSSTDLITTDDRLFNERWVLANGIFEILFGFPPFFFLRDSDVNTQEKYYKKNNWPSIDYSSDLVNQTAVTRHQNLMVIFQQIRDNGSIKLTESFEKVFNLGLNNGRSRLSPSEWEYTLFKIYNQEENKPIINSFSSDKLKITRKGEDVTFKWDIEKYNRVYIEGQLQKISESQTTISLQDSDEILIKIVNDFGETEDRIQIDSIKILPTIISFSASKVFRDSINPIELSWKVKDALYVTIKPLSQKGKLNLKDAVEVMPTLLTKYKLTAYGYFGEEITREIQVDVIEPKVETFIWEVNLNHGINFIDLKWKTKNAEHVIITPQVGQVSNEGKEHVSIDGKTLFTIKAKGLFKEVEKTLYAQPYPVPIISHLFTESPSLSFKSNINISFRAIPKEITDLSEMSLNSSIDIENSLIKFSSLNEEKLNSLSLDIKDVQTRSDISLFSISKLFHNIKKRTKKR